ncbi:hypothetical protein BJ122_11983 [Rhodopseudomonas faecalis]|uniref:Uncharacterized protein n=1 Tax=Rhodopseudomonas faecalis TaxID=99655 RepID=A0A318TAK0_9BRAD|nr:hypothetical protein [Rhodopseudomonas faecalis]PYF01676.1 hypothetical protein BJ122_11983 [Rhodopseudomonas faecalis]
MSTQSKQETNAVSAPWSVQQPYLQQAFSGASSALGKTNANTYSGQQVAQFTPDQLATFRRMSGFGADTGAASGTMATGAGVANAGASALQAAMKSMEGFAPQGGTDTNITAAGQYADNPYISGAIDAAMRDANRQVNEQALPGQQRSAALTGNTMSSKNALAQGVIQRGLAEKAADVSATMRQQAYQTGLGLAEQGRQFDNNAILDAMKASAATGGSAFSSGVDAVSSGIEQAKGLFDIANAGGAGQQQNTQNQIDDARTQKEYANSNTWQNLQNFYNIIGGNNWGGTQNSTTTSTPSQMNTIGGLLGAGGQLARLLPFNWK